MYIIHVESENAYRDSSWATIDPKLVSCMKQLILAHPLAVGVIDDTIPEQPVDNTTQHLQVRASVQLYTV